MGLNGTSLQGRLQMKKLTVLAILFLLAPAFSADASGKGHHKHSAATSQKSRPAESEPTPSGPPVTRLPVAPDTFRA
jgi:hypothetical protein